VQDPHRIEEIGAFGLIQARETPGDEVLGAGHRHFVLFAALPSEGKDNSTAVRRVNGAIRHPCRNETVDQLGSGRKGKAEETRKIREHRFIIPPDERKGAELRH
jgi:hypothetical protein